MAEHIDSDRLHLDLRYRFEYLSKFLHFTSEDIAMLNTFAPMVFPLIPVLSDTVYRKLFSFDITKQYFLIHNEGFEGFLPHKRCGITLDSIEMELRRDMLTMYLKRILTQRQWNDSFLEYLSQVGKFHANITDSNRTQVEYIHINALLAYLEQLLIDVLYNAENTDETSKRGILLAINKFFWIQNDFFTMNYFLTSNKNSHTSKVSKCCWF